MRLTRRNFTGRLAAAAAAFGAGLLGMPRTVRAAASGVLEKIRGLVVRRGEPDYDLQRASMVWYLFKPARYPDMIVRAETDQDLVQAVNYARESGLKIATRATGHNPARGCLRQGGLLLDTSRLRDVRIDAAGGTAWVQPGMRSEEFVEQTSPHGWSFPAAHTGIVGLGGYLIGGGLGWNMGDWDIACRSIIGAEIVLANGQRVTVSDKEHPDLLWAVRGAGPGFFGAVLRYRLRLFPAPRAIVKSKYLVPIDRLDALLGELSKIAASKQRRLEILAVIGHFGAPDLPPAKRDLVCAVSAVAFGNTREESLQLLAPVRDSRVPALSSKRRENVLMTYPVLYGGNETDYSSPRRTAIHNIWTNDIADAFGALAERWQKTPPRSPRSFALTAWGINPSPQDDDSVFTYTGNHYMSWYLMAESESDIAPNDVWMDAAVERLQPWTRGHYPNEINPGRYPDAMRRCFSPAKWKRLEQLRRQYDPDGRFHSYLGFS